MPKRGTPARLTGEDLSFWWVDSPMQPVTMAMLMVLDRAPDQHRLRQAFQRAVTAVPRLSERVIEAPLDLTLPHWEPDPTFDLDYHVRHHALPGTADTAELLREIAPAYETPFDRSRPLWEARVYDGLGDGRAALFFKLHHAVADGVGSNAIFAALTDADRTAAVQPLPGPPPVEKAPWPEQPWLPTRLVEALRDRAALDWQRARTVAGAVAGAVRDPSKLDRAAQALRSMTASMRFDSRSPIKASAGRARRLSGIELPFSEVRSVKAALGGSMIDVILTIMARAMGAWHRAHHLRQVRELLTLVPVNLRRPEDWTEKAQVGNVATGILVPLPITLPGALPTYREVRRRMDEKKADPASAVTPLLADILSVCPRPFVSWVIEAVFGNIDFIVTNVPGILVPRYLAGAEILAAYPFAPVAMHSPASVALYGYREHLFIGLSSDEGTMPDVEAFQRMIVAAFEELRVAAGLAPRARRPRRAAGKRPRAGAADKARRVPRKA